VANDLSQIKIKNNYKLVTFNIKDPRVNIPVKNIYYGGLTLISMT